MSYKEKFNASEHKAHYKNIATKISRDMTELRSKVENSPTTPRRWVWELIQNAKDVHYSTGVDIEIVFEEDKKKLVFKHNGRPFSADNIRFLIEQISSKEREKDENGKVITTGKFGTGFMTTHMLSERVTVRGVAKEQGEDYRKFKFELDRSGFELHEIIEAVEASKSAVSNLDDLPPYLEYDLNNYNTIFTYPLADDISLSVAKAGLADLKRCLPYSMIFAGSINSLTIAHLEEIYTCDDLEEIKEDEVVIRTINIDDQIIGEESIFIATVSKGFTTIAVPITVNFESGITTVLELNKEIPRLFCDFPLIGTESFPFPVIINNPNFNPTDARDGIFLNDSSRANPLLEENKKIIKQAVELYNILLAQASAKNWENLHLLATGNSIKDSFEWLSDNWYNKEVLTPIKQKLLTAKIVRTEAGNLESILDSEGKHYIWFPYSHKKEIREGTWELASKLMPFRIPAKNTVEIWHKLIWNDCGKLTLDFFADIIESFKTPVKFGERLGDTDVFLWLNDFYKLIRLDEKEFHLIIDKKVIIPNQNNAFMKKSQLYRDAGDIRELFKDILSDLSNNIRETLAHSEIEIDFEREIDQQHIIRLITSEVSEKANDREIAKDFRVAFNKILLYFKDKPEEAKKYFPTIFKAKHLLYDDEEILDNISKAEELKELLQEFNVDNTEALRELLAKSKESDKSDSLLPITQEILASMGITSVEEWRAALEDKDIKALFSHRSVPTDDMFVWSQSHIAKAKKAVIKHLKTLDEYDLSQMDEDTAPTILAGVLKHSQTISIVVRPAYNYEVIIYYGSEKDVLDYVPSELWIEDPDGVRQISLGHILKKTQIRKFPV